MILNVDFKGAYGCEDIDLEELYKLDWVLCEADMEEAIRAKLGFIAAEDGGITGFAPDYVKDDDGNELHVSDRKDWIGELSKFAWHVLDESSDSDEWKKYFAYVYNVGWAWFNFDRMNKIDEEYFQELEGDIEDFAKGRMAEDGDSIPDYLESHFDYESYGESLLEDYSRCEWNYVEYLFTK